MTGATAPSPVVEEFKKDLETVSLYLQPIAMGNLMTLRSVTSTNVIHNISYSRAAMRGSIIFQLIYLGLIQFK